MEQAKALDEARFVVVWGVLGWGGSTALLITLANWYTTHRIETPYMVGGRFVVFMGSGIVFGMFVWSRREALGIRTATRTGNILRLVFFIILMFALAIALWTMTRR
jgi:hypothetical protein